MRVNVQASSSWQKQKRPGNESRSYCGTVIQLETDFNVGLVSNFCATRVIFAVEQNRIEISVSKICGVSCFVPSMKSGLTGYE